MTIIDPRAQTVTINLYEGHGESWHTVYRVGSEQPLDGSSRVSKQYTDQICEWGVDGDETPVYRRIRTTEQPQTSDWRPYHDPGI